MDLMHLPPVWHPPRSYPLPFLHPLHTPSPLLTHAWAPMHARERMSVCLRSPRPSRHASAHPHQTQHASHGRRRTGIRSIPRARTHHPPPPPPHPPRAVLEIVRVGTGCSYSGGNGHPPLRAHQRRGSRTPWGGVPLRTGIDEDSIPPVTRREAPRDRTYPRSHSSPPGSHSPLGHLRVTGDSLPHLKTPSGEGWGVATRIREGNPSAPFHRLHADNGFMTTFRDAQGDDDVYVTPSNPLPVTVTSQSAQALPTAWASGTATAPAAGAVIADTGALAAGNYRIEYSAGFAAVLAAGKGLLVEHRDAANTATLHQTIVPAGQRASDVWTRVPMAANERVRVVNAAVIGEASSVAQAEVRAIPA